MSKIILTLATTLDGYISGPNGETDWLVRDENTDYASILSEILDGVDAIFYGRKSYELWGHYRPGAEAPQKLKEAYDLLHSKKKFVFSSSVKSDGASATFLNSCNEQNIFNIKKELKGNIWLYGGGKLITSFINLNLVDIYSLAVHPVIIGKGIPLFENINSRIQLRLKETQTATSGVILLTYAAKK